MHEHSLADAIIEKAESLRRESGASHIARLSVRVSELSSLSEEALQMMMDHAAEEEGVAPFTVDLVSDGLLGYCGQCGLAPISEELVCSACGATGCRPALDEGMLLVSCTFE
jgi:Zn finger protein HypA/HybF involved in hydrogenase expression